MGQVGLGGGREAGLGVMRLSLVVGFRHGGHVVEAGEPGEAGQARGPRVGQREVGTRGGHVLGQREGQEAPRVPLGLELRAPEQLHLRLLELPLQLLQAQRALGRRQEVLGGAGAREAHGGPAQVAAHVSQRGGHHEGRLLRGRAARPKEQAGGPPGGGLAAAPGPGHAAALALDVAVQVVGAREALVAELALVGPHARVDAHVVLEVVVVHELGVAVDAQVGPLPRVLPHMDLQLVLPARQSQSQSLPRTPGATPHSLLPFLQNPLRLPTAVVSTLRNGTPARIYLQLLRHPKQVWLLPWIREWISSWAQRGCCHSRTPGTHKLRRMKCPLCQGLSHRLQNRLAGDRGPESQQSFISPPVGQPLLILDCTFSSTLSRQQGLSSRFTLIPSQPLGC